jgi:hypothetical protein
VELGFTLAYCDKSYTQVTISRNGYVCLGNNSLCSSQIRPTPYDIIVGLNYDLNVKKIGSGQIYFKRLDSESTFFKLSQNYVSLLNSAFLAKHVFMITYDDVLTTHLTDFSSRAWFQIFLVTDTEQSYVILKYKSCLANQILTASSGLNHNNVMLKLFQQVNLAAGQECISSNVGIKGVWVTEVTNVASGRFEIFVFSLL